MPIARSSFLPHRYALDSALFISLGWVSAKGFTHGYLKIMPYHSGIAKHVGIYYDFIYAVASFFIRFGMLAGGTFVYWFWYLARSPAYKPAKAGALAMLFGAWYARAHVVYHWMIVCKVCLVPARRSSAEHLMIATKALRCTATAWIPHCR